MDGKVGRLEGWKVSGLRVRRPDAFLFGRWHAIVGTLLILLSILLMTSNCYLTSASALPSGIRTVAIPLFQDATVETDVKEQLTDAIVAKFLANNQLRVVDVRDADAMVIGTITDIREEALAFSQGTTSNELRIWIIANVRFEDVGNRNVIWEAEDLQSFGDYEVDTGTETDREPGILTAVNKMADEILNRTISGW